MNVLIVEDEKMIRQGIKTMIQRSGFQMDMIIECMNGEMALEVLKNQSVDIMFTDIRMPKMTGIELVKKMQQLPSKKPLTVVISGYDEFSYAVEMMRYGVREYILKPVEREKIQELLEKFIKEIDENQKEAVADEKISVQQFKYFMLNKKATREEWEILEGKYAQEFYKGDFYVCCCKYNKNKIESGQYIYIHDLEGSDIYIVEKEKLAFVQKNELSHSFYGVSNSHCGIKELSKAYDEAQSARKQSFCTNQACVFFESVKAVKNNQLRETAQMLLTKESCMKKVQLLGTQKQDEMAKIWEGFFHFVLTGYITPEEIQLHMIEFAQEVKKTYSHLSEKVTVLDGIEEEIFQKENLEQFKNIFMEELFHLNKEIIHILDHRKSADKMKQAVQYILENYMKDLNMAVVSNHISMNYSLFSASFKEYTGSNFVNYLKDIRMEEAKKLLTQTNKKIIEISQEIGYENEKHFMKTFKNTYGVSPSEYRKNTGTV